MIFLHRFRERSSPRYIDNLPNRHFAPRDSRKSRPESARWRAEKAEAKAKATHAHRQKVHHAVVTSLVEYGTSEQQAKSIVTMIRSDKIAHVRIVY